MRLFTLVLAGLLLLIQYPLWLGKGGWLRAWDLDRQLDTQRATNDKLRARNAAIAAEVRDLRQGLLAVEERARYELGMIRENEIFVQLAVGPASTPHGVPGAAAGAAAGAGANAGSTASAGSPARAGTDSSAATDPNAGRNANAGAGPGSGPTGAPRPH